MPANLLLIDTSYFVFYRYYATLSWFKRVHATDAISIETLLENAEFMEMYAKKFEETILKLCKMHKVQMHKELIFVKDCFRDQIWRMEHFKEYKGNREERLKTFNSAIFKHTYRVLLPRLIEKYAFKVVEHPHAEADDIIAVIHRTIRADPAQAQRLVTIITNDNDLLQLYDASTMLLNLAHKRLESRIPAQCSTPQQVVQLKVLMGDKSDNIPPTMRKMGVKTAWKYLEQPDALEKKLKEDKDFARRHHLNSLLIDFHSIPENIVHAIQSDIRPLIDLHSWDVRDGSSRAGGAVDAPSVSAHEQ